MISKNTLLTAV